MDIKRVDSWLIKGFDGITNLIIQRSHTPASPELVQVLEACIHTLESVTKSVIAQDSTLNVDFQMFSTLLQLTELLRLRIKADKNLDKMNIEALQGYITTLQKALERFYEQRADCSKGLERTRGTKVLSRGS